MIKSSEFSWGSLTHYCWCSIRGIHYKSPIFVSPVQVWPEKGPVRQHLQVVRPGNIKFKKRSWEGKFIWWVATRILKCLEIEVFLLFTQTVLWLSLALFLYNDRRDTHMIAVFRYFNSYVQYVSRSQNHYQLEEIVVGQIVTHFNYNDSSLTFFIQFHRHLLSSYYN